MSGRDAIRPALVPGHGAPPDSARPGSGSGGRSNVDASARGRASAINWASLAPYYAEFEAEKKRRREEREGEGQAS